MNPNFFFFFKIIRILLQFVQILKKLVIDFESSWLRLGRVLPDPINNACFLIFIFFKIFLLHAIQGLVEGENVIFFKKKYSLTKNILASTT
jgi:hypothetical protein